jgi:DNA-binding transcriptional MerR regulator
VAEYRLEELADASGVSSRNIRAYRERGLLDPPRREGRSSIYDEHHLGQLKTISDLLRRGFSSAHIAEFFSSVRRGHELADLLGLREASFRPRPTPPVAVDPGSPEAGRACELGIARLVEGRLSFVNPKLAAIVAGADDPLDYVRTLLRVHDATAGGVEAVAAARSGALEQSLAAHYGENFVPRSDQMAALLRRVADYRTLADHVVADLLDAVVQRRLMSTVSSYTAARLTNGDWPPEPS